MRFAVSIATAVMALAGSAFAQTADFDPIYKPAKGEAVPAGSTYKVTWQAPAKYSGTIKISLIGGETQDTQVPLMDIASGVSNTAESYEWAVDSKLGDDKFYGLVFKYESDPSIFQYSNPFTIKSSGGSYPQPGSSASSTMTTSTGIKTVTLSSSPYSTPEVTSTVMPTTSAMMNTTSIVKPTYSTGFNMTTSIKTTMKPTLTVVTSTAMATQPSATQPTTVPTETPGAGARVGAGSMAFVGAVAMAVLVL